MNRRFKRWAFAIFALLIISLGLLIIRPVPELSPENAQIVKGTIKEISEAGTYDVVIELEETDQIFYINRGLKKLFDLGQLQSQLIGKEVAITYPRYWSPLDLQNSWKNVSILEIEEKVIYSEL